jgi:hypothetical protein
MFRLCGGANLGFYLSDGTNQAAFKRFLYQYIILLYNKKSVINKIALIAKKYFSFY